MKKKSPRCHVTDNAIKQCQEQHIQASQPQKCVTPHSLAAGATAVASMYGQASTDTDSNRLFHLQGNNYMESINVDHYTGRSRWLAPCYSTRKVAQRISNVLVRIHLFAESWAPHSKNSVSFSWIRRTLPRHEIHYLSYPIFAQNNSLWAVKNRRSDQFNGDIAKNNQN